MKEIIKLEGEIDLTKTPNECRIKPIENDIWNDFGYWLEVGGFILRNAAKYQEKGIDEMVQYATGYLKKAAEDYRIQHPTQT